MPIVEHPAGAAIPQVIGSVADATSPALPAEGTGGAPNVFVVHANGTPRGRHHTVGRGASASVDRRQARSACQIGEP